MVEKDFWLASNSPRRREILGWLDWEIQAAPANIDESRRASETARDYVMRVACEKAAFPIPQVRSGSVVIAADTIVVLGDEVLGKPLDARDAYSMLAKLRGRTHQVLTAIAVNTAGRIVQDLCSSPVIMREYLDEEMDAYIASRDPMDKAGAYAIQNSTFHPAAGFNGCFASVMGMPLCHLERTLKMCGIIEPEQFGAVCQNHLKYRCPITDRVMAGEDIG
jgi:MAF protein